MLWVNRTGLDACTLSLRYDLLSSTCVLGVIALPFILLLPRPVIGRSARATRLLVCKLIEQVYCCHVMEHFASDKHSWFVIIFFFLFSDCHACYHRGCFRTGKDCPRCRRLAERRERMARKNMEEQEDEGGGD